MKVVDLKSRGSITDWIRADRYLLFSASSLIGMLDNDDGDADLYKHKAEPNSDECVTPEETATNMDVRCDSDVEERANAEVVKDELNAEQPHLDVQTDNGEEVSSTEEATAEHISQTCLDYNGNVVTTDTYVKQADDTLNVSVGEISTRHVDTETKPKIISSDSSSSSNDDILLNRHLSPKFFSRPGNKAYGEFTGEVEDEVEEDIEAGDNQSESNLVDEITKNMKSNVKTHKKRVTYGQGAVCLDAGDIKAAISRLASLRESNDPGVDTTIIHDSRPPNEDIDKGDRYCAAHDIGGQDIALEGRNEEIECNTNIDQEETFKIEHYTENTDRTEEQRLTSKPDDANDTTASVEGTQRDIEEIDNREKDTTKDSGEIEKYNSGKSMAEYQLEATKVAATSVECRSYTEKDVEGVHKKATAQVERAVVQEGTDGREMNAVVNLDENKLSETSVESSISLAAALSLDAIKSHTSRSDCCMSFYVRSPHFSVEPRKIEVRASPRQIKDGSAEKHLKLLTNVHLPVRPACQASLTAKSSKKHLFSIPALAVQDSTRATSWVQKRGNPDLPQTHRVPSFFEPTPKTPNAREKFGLDNLQKFKIGVQCKPIERIKMDAEEFPGILPPRIRAKWKQKMEEKKHIN